MESQIQQLKHKTPDQLTVRLHCTVHTGDRLQDWVLLILLSFSSHFSIDVPLEEFKEGLGFIYLSRDGSLSAYVFDINKIISYEISYACLPNGINPPTTTPTTTTTTKGIYIIFAIIIRF